MGRVIMPWHVVANGSSMGRTESTGRAHSQGIGVKWKGA